MMTEFYFSVSSIMSASDIVIKLIAQGASQVQGALGSVGTSLRNAAKDSDTLKSGLESVRNASLAVAATGGVGLAISEGLVNASLEADRLGGRLASVMKGKGLDDGIDKIKELGNAIAGLTGGDDDAIAGALGSAIASGRLNSLREYGIVIDANGQAAISAAKKISAQAGAQETLNQVLRAGSNAVQNLRENTSEATAALGEFNVRWGNLEEGIGAGAANAKAAILDGLFSPIMSVVEASPELQNTIGAIGYVGSSALTAGAGVVSLASQIGMIALSFPGLGASATAAFGFVKLAAATTIPFLTGVATALAVPFAILAAGAAIGIAGYEALRAMNIGGFGDSHKSTSEIMADTRKTLMGDPAADAKAATEAATKALPPVVIPPIATPPMPIAAPVAPLAALPTVAPKPTTSSTQGAKTKDDFVNEAIRRGAFLDTDGGLALPDDMEPSDSQVDALVKKLGGKRKQMTSSTRGAKAKDDGGRRDRVREAIEMGASNESEFGWQVPDGILDGSAEDKNALIDALNARKRKQNASSTQGAQADEDPLLGSIARLLNGENIFDVARNKNGALNTRSGATPGGQEEYAVRMRNNASVEPSGQTRVKFIVDDLILPRSPLQRAFG